MRKEKEKILHSTITSDSETQIRKIVIIIYICYMF